MRYPLNYYPFSDVIRLLSEIAHISIDSAAKVYRIYQDHGHVVTNEAGLVGFKHGCLWNPVVIQDALASE